MYRAGRLPPGRAPNSGYVHAWLARHPRGKQFYFVKKKAWPGAHLHVQVQPLLDEEQQAVVVQRLHARRAHDARAANVALRRVGEGWGASQGGSRTQWRRVEGWTGLGSEVVGGTEGAAWGAASGSVPSLL